MSGTSKSIPKTVTGIVLTRATRRSMTAVAFSALFLTVINNQPIFAVYLANHLGAPSSLLGALFGFMLATGALQLVSVFVYRALPRRKLYWIVTALLHRALGLAVVLSALLFSGGMAGLDAARIVAYALGLSWILANLSGSGWLSWMADLFPEEVRAGFFLRRSAVFQTATVAWFFAASVLLDLVPDSGRSIAYAVIFGIGTLGGLADILFHLGIPEPSFVKEGGGMSLAEFLAPFRDRNFLRYAIGIGIAFFAVFFASPFQAPWLTDPAGIAAPNVWLGIMTVISVLAWVAMAPLWGFVMDRYGRKPVVILGCLLVTGWIGFFFIDHRNYSFLLPVIALVSGFFSPAFWEGSGQFMLTLAPGPKRVVYIAWYNTIVGLVAALGPVAGGFFEERISAGGGLSLLPGLPPVSGFASIQAAALVIMVIALLILRGVKEGGERPVAGLVTQIASAGLFRSYVSLLDLRRHSGDPRVSRALRRIDGDEGELVLREVVDHLDDPSPEVREEALRALGRVRSPVSRDALVGRLLDRGSDLRVEAARALGRLGDIAAISALEEAMRDPNPVLRAACAGSLGSLAGRSEGTRLAEILKGEADEGVRAAAALGASSWPSPKGEGDDRSAAEGLELLAGLAAAPDSARVRQYAIGIANLLGKPGSFAPYATGDEGGRAARGRRVFESLARRVESLPGLAGAEGEAVARGLLEAYDSGEGRPALAAVLACHDRVIASLFGSFARPQDLQGLLARTDSRLGAWNAVAAGAKARLDGLDDEAASLLALVGAWYLSSD